MYGYRPTYIIRDPAPEKCEVYMDEQLARDEKVTATPPSPRAKSHTRDPLAQVRMSQRARADNRAKARR